MAVRTNVIAWALLAASTFGQSAPSPPIPIYKAEPEYTEQARNAKIEGSVSVQVVIDENGVPQYLKVKRSLDKGLDEKAIEAATRWRFKPATRENKPVSVAATIEVVFKLPK